MKIEIEITNQVLEDIFVTAMEGGSNFWYEFAPKDIKKVREYCKEGPLSIAVFKAITKGGLEMDVFDVEAEPEDEPIGKLSLSTFKERLEKMMADDTYRSDLLSEMQENGDAGTSDNVFQYLALGEVIYS